MKENLIFTTDCANRGYIIACSDLVVDMHNRHNSGVFTKSIGNCLRLNQAIFIWVQIGNFKAFTLKLATGIQSRLVLDTRGNHMLAFALVKVRAAFNR